MTLIPPSPTTLFLPTLLLPTKTLAPSHQQHPCKQKAVSLNYGVDPTCNHFNQGTTMVPSPTAQSPNKPGPQERTNLYTELWSASIYHGANETPTKSFAFSDQAKKMYTIFWMEMRIPIAAVIHQVPIVRSHLPQSLWSWCPIFFFVFHQEQEQLIQSSSCLRGCPWTDSYSSFNSVEMHVMRNNISFHFSQDILKINWHISTYSLTSFPGWLTPVSSPLSFEAPFHVLLILHIFSNISICALIQF